MKVSELKDIDYAELLEEATANASTDWEMGFVESLCENFREYQERTFVSEKQLSILQRIANAEQ